MRFLRVSYIIEIRTFKKIQERIALWKKRLVPANARAAKDTAIARPARLIIIKNETPKPPASVFWKKAESPLGEKES